MPSTAQTSDFGIVTACYMDLEDWIDVKVTGHFIAGALGLPTAARFIT